MNKFRYYLLLFMPAYTIVSVSWYLADILLNLQSPSWMYPTALIFGLIGGELHFWPKHNKEYNFVSSEGKDK